MRPGLSIYIYIYIQIIHYYLWAIGLHEGNLNNSFINLQSVEFSLAAFDEKWLATRSQGLWDFGIFVSLFSNTNTLFQHDVHQFYQPSRSYVSRWGYSIVSFRFSSSSELYLLRNKIIGLNDLSCYTDYRRSTF